MARELSARQRQGLGIVLAVVAGLGSWFYLEGRRRDLERGTEMTTVLVTKAYVPAGKMIGDDVITTRRVPVAYLEPGAIGDRRDLGKESRSRISLMKGEQLTRSKVELPGARQGLAWVVPPGERALGLRLSLESAAGGHLIPGDRVDVLAVSRDRRVAVPLETSVRVLSVGEKIWDAAEAPVTSPPPGESILVTLALSPRSAERVAGESERATLILALVSPLDGQGAE